MTTIHTERLTLIPLPAVQLGMCLDDPAQFEHQLDLKLATTMLTDVARRAIRMKLDKMSRADERDHPWYTYWLIVVREAGTGAGLAGFKGSPGVEGKYDRIGEVEIGYGIAPEFEGKGYMTEAVRTLIAWAFEHPDCHAVIAPHVLKSNPGSARVLEKVGMAVYAETEETRSYRVERASRV